MKTADKVWVELGRRSLLRGFGRGVDEVLYEMPEGAQEVYHVAVQPNTVAVLATTPDDRVLLVPQFRPGPNRVLRELPGGFVEPGEDPVEAAIRELFEETG